MRHLILVGSISLDITFLQDVASLILSPPAPQKASNIVYLTLILADT